LYQEHFLSEQAVSKFEMDIESTGERKKQRVLNLNPTNAPEGFHYEGEPVKWFEGKTSHRLRKDKDGPGSRQDNYRDLFVETRETDISGKLVCTFHCCIDACPRPAASGSNH